MRLILLPPEDLAQTLGALYTFRHTIRELILLAGPQGAEKKRIDRFAAKLRRYANTAGLPWQKVAVAPFDESDPAAYSRLRARYIADDKDVTILAADAATATTLLAARAFGEGAALLAYDAYDNRLSLFDGAQVRHFQADAMGLENYCGMLGYTLAFSTRPEELSRDEMAAVRRLFANEAEFSRIRLRLLRGERITGTRQTEDLERLGILRNGRIVDHHAENRLKGTLFEEYIFALCQQMGFDEVRMGCGIDFSAGEDLPHPVRNEFDILFIENNRIGTVECKYTQEGFNARKFLYQYDTVMDYFGRTARAILLNIHKDNTPRTRDYLHTVLRRSRFGNVRILADSHFDESRFKNLLRWAGEEGVNLS